jgi:hypothetical protein
LEQKIRAFYDEENNRLFDLTKGPLFSAKLIQLKKDEEYIIVFTIHHIIADYISMEVIIHDFLSIYNKQTLPSLRIQYKDYALWNKSQLAGKKLEELEDYWLEEFKDPIPKLGLPYDNKRPQILTYNGESALFTLQEEIIKVLKELCEENDVTVFMLLLTFIVILLYYYSGQTDLVLGTPIAGRMYSELENQIGYYLNTLPLRIRFNEKGTFFDILKIVKKNMLEVYEFQLYPFDMLVEKLKLKKDVSRNQIFDMAVNLINSEGSVYSSVFNGVKDKSIQFNKTRSKYDLAIYIIQSDHSIGLSFEYNSDLFNSDTITRMINRYKLILENIKSDLNTPISELDLEKKNLRPSFSSFINK